MGSWRMKYLDKYSNWSTAWDITSPNNELNVDLQSTMQTEQLYDGSRGRKHPTTKFNYAPIEINWDWISGTNVLILNGEASVASSFSLETLMSAGYKVELTTHVLKVSGATSVSQAWQGYFKDVQKNYLMGLHDSAGTANASVYDITATFDLMTISET